MYISHIRVYIYKCFLFSDLILRSGYVTARQISSDASEPWRSCKDLRPGFGALRRSGGCTSAPPNPRDPGMGNDGKIQKETQYIYIYLNMGNKRYDHIL